MSTTGFAACLCACVCVCAREYQSGEFELINILYVYHLFHIVFVWDLVPPIHWYDVSWIDSVSFFSLTFRNVVLQYNRKLASVKWETILCRWRAVESFPSTQGWSTNNILNIWNSMFFTHVQHPTVSRQLLKIGIQNKNWNLAHNNILLRIISYTIFRSLKKKKKQITFKQDIITLSILFK